MRALTGRIAPGVAKAKAVAAAGRAAVPTVATAADPGITAPGAAPATRTSGRLVARSALPAARRLPVRPRWRRDRRRFVGPVVAMGTVLLGAMHGMRA